MQYRERVDFIRCRAREPYGSCLLDGPLKDQLLCGLLVVGQWSDGGGQQGTVRDVQHAVLGRKRRVEQPDRRHSAVQGAAQCTRSDPYLFPSGVRAGEEQHEASEHVGQGPLRRNADNYAGDRTSDQKVPDRQREQVHRGERHDQVADQQRPDAKRHRGSGSGAERVTRLSSLATLRVAASPKTTNPAAVPCAARRRSSVAACTPPK